MDGDDTDAGERLWAQAPRLRLLLRHLAGPALRERVELDDLVQETFLRVLASPLGLDTARGAAPGRDAPGRDATGGDVGDADSDAELWRLLVHVARHVVVDVARAARAAKRGGVRAGLPGAAGAAVGADPGASGAASGAPARSLPRGDWSVAGRGVSQLAAITAGPATRAIGREMQSRLEQAFTALSAEHRRVLGLRQLQGLSAEEAGARMGRSAAAVHSLYRRALLAWEAALSGEVT